MAKKAPEKVEAETILKVDQKSPNYLMLQTCVARAEACEAKAALLSKEKEEIKATSQKLVLQMAEMLNVNIEEYGFDFQNGVFILRSAIQQQSQ